MYRAFSIKLQKIITIDDYLASPNKNDRFLCADPKCRVPVVPCAVDQANIAAHFRASKGHSHKPNCTEGTVGVRKDVATILKGKSPRQIYDKILNAKPSAPHGSSNKYPQAHSSSNILRTNTLTELLAFCMNSPKETVIHEDETVETFFVNKALARENPNRNYKGLKLVLAQTYRYIKDDKIIELSIPLGAKDAYLHFNLVFDSQLFYRLKDEITSTFEHFSGHEIAVLGDWVKVDDTTYKCYVPRVELLIRRYLHEKS